MINKKNNEDLKFCPFIKKKCRTDCMFFRKGVRFNEQRKESFPFQDCVFNLIGDNLEAMHNRTYMMQSEVGAAKNVLALKILSEVADLDPREVGRQALKTLGIKPGDNVAGTRIEVDGPNQKKIEG